MIYAGREMTATIAGGRIEPVVCERCRTHFFYELTRVASGKASAPYFLFQGAATNRAEARAGRALATRLDADVEMVPCPKCLWVNKSLIDRYRRGLYRGAGKLNAIILASSFVVGPLLFGVLSEGFGLHSPNVMAVIPLTVLAAVVASIIVLIVRHRWRMSIDPNRLHPRPPVLPPGTPPAMVEEVDVRTGQTVLRAVPRPEDPQAFGTHEWAVLRPGQMKLPPNCCVCLGQPQTYYHSPVSVNSTNEDLPVPLCGTCASRLAGKWWLILLASGFAIAGTASLMAIVMTFGDAFGRWFLFGTIGGISALVAPVILANSLCRPYQIRAVDPSRGIFRFRAKNAGFTALVAGLAKKAEAVRPPLLPAAPVPVPPRRSPPRPVDQGPIPLE